MSQFDLIVVGGGINGLWSALIAQQQGLKVALYEKNDFGSGTSGRSTQLIHGGLRYLEHGELKLVYESLHERTWLLKNIPQLVKPLLFYIPVFKSKPLLGIKYFMGLLLYYVLSGGRGTFPKWVSPQKLNKENPNLETDFLLGALEYFDAQTNDRALCHFLAEECTKQGISIFKEHEVVSIQKDVNGYSVEVLDKTKQQVMTVASKVVLSAKGPWEDKKYLRPTKGVHLFFEKFTGEHGYLLSATDDRVFFVLPYEGKTLIGTTDTNYLGSPDEVKTEDADRKYLIEQTGRYFKNIKNVKQLGDYAGIRPLMNSGAATNAKASRRDFLIESENGYYHMIGGKLTTGRAFATRTVKKILNSHFKNIKFQQMHWRMAE